MTTVSLDAIAPGRLSPAEREVAVIGLGKSGTPVARLLARAGHRVYASDAATSAASADAAARLEEEGIDARAGGHDLERIRRAGLVVTSPGIPPHAPPIVAAREAGIPLATEIEIALQTLVGLRYIAVTGTNGKTTTTGLIGQLLRALGLDAVEGGNIGLPLAQYALDGQAPDWVALELSSFQLRHTPSLRPDVGVVTNLAPDHLDWYPSIDAYYADKALLFVNDGAYSRWVLNADDPETLALHRRLPHGHESLRTLRGAISLFSLNADGGDAWFDRDSDRLMLDGAPLLDRRDLPLLGAHNVANALAAALAVSRAVPPDDATTRRGALAAALRMAAPLPHRMEPVGEFAGVLWINDSKATNVSSTRVALDGMTRPYVLLLGGRHKGESYASLAEPFARHGQVVLAYGEAAPTIVADLQGLVPVERVEGSFDAVAERARALAGGGEAVLLSPACSSYDMFNNYEERGAAFRRLARGTP